MADLRLSGISKSYGGVQAVKDIDLAVEDGEFFTLLGPSGCGKSTLLALVAGLEAPDEGTITVGGVTLADRGRGIFVPPERRDCGLVFQSYALWPNMTVAENVRFALKLRKLSKAEQEKRIDESLELVSLQHLAKRYPHEMSGGQQQRAALARTLAYRPRLLLLDEPLSNLDAKLRSQARTWLKEIHDRVRVTTVYVTHDQEEALALSARVAMIRDGVVAQVDDPVGLFDRPADLETAMFIGRTGVLDGVVTSVDDKAYTVHLSGSGEMAQELDSDRPRLSVGQQVQLAIRPEWVRIEPLASDPHDTSAYVLGRRVLSEYIGGSYEHLVTVGTNQLRARTTQPLESSEICVRILRANLPVFPTDNEVIRDMPSDTQHKEVAIRE